MLVLARAIDDSSASFGSLLKNWSTEMKGMTAMSQKRKITAEDLYAIKFVSDPQISPDGKLVAYVQTEIDPKTKDYTAQIWVVPAEEEPPASFETLETSGHRSSEEVRREAPLKPSASPNSLGTVSGQEPLPESPGGPSPAPQTDAGQDNRGLAPLPQPRRLTGGPKRDFHPRWSPDGRKLAFLSDRSGEKQIWLLDLDTGGEARPLTQMKNGVSAFVWSPDGKRLAFVSKVGPDEKYADLIQPPRPEEKEAQEKRAKEQVRVVDRIRYKSDEAGFLENKFNHIWVIEVDGGQPKQLTFGDYDDAAPAWSPDGRFLAFSSNRTPEPDYNPAVSDIWVIAAEGGEPVRLTNSRGPASQPSWSWDGRWIAYFGHEMEYNNATLTRLWKVPFNPELMSKTTPPAKTEGHPGVPPSAATQSALPPRGNDELSATNPVGPKSIPTSTEDRAPVCLTLDFDRSLGDQGMSDMRAHPSLPGPIWSRDDSQIYFLASDSGNTHLFAVSAAGGPVRPLTQGSKQIFGLSFDAERRHAALAFTDPLVPGDIVVLTLAEDDKDGSRGSYRQRDFSSVSHGNESYSDRFAESAEQQASFLPHNADPGSKAAATGSNERRLTAVNEPLLSQVLLSQPEEIHFSAPDGWPLHGWIMKPADFHPGEKYPLILEIHGGPHAMYSNSFFLEFQLLAANGYVVLYTNPRGSQGYGQEFVRAVQGDYGGKDFADLMAAVDYALSLGFVDSERLGVTGGSYGGFMTNWVVGHTNRFKAAVTQRSISNWISFYGTSDIGYYFTEWEIEGQPWADPAKLLAHSPLSYVDQIKTPLLILHSEKDYRCPIEQAEQLFVALKRLKRETQLVRFPESNHDLSRNGKPVLRVERLNRILGWFKRFLEPNT